MGINDYTWVSQPHDPLSISGSDPYIKSTDYWPTVNSSHQARLVVWYNFDDGNAITGSARDHGAHQLHSVKDISPNSKSRPFTGVGTNTAATRGLVRHLNADGDRYKPIMSGNMGGANNKNLHINGDRQQFLRSSFDLSYGTDHGVHMGMGEPGTYHNDADVEHEWISSSSDNTHAYGTLCGGYSIFATMKYRSNSSYGDDYWFGVTYPNSTHDYYSYNGEDGHFCLGLRHNGSTDARYATVAWNDGQYKLNTQAPLSHDWHNLNFQYDRQADRSTWKCALYLGGKLQQQDSGTPGSGNYPKQYHNNRRFAIGGHADGGGGYVSDMRDMTADPTSSYGVFLHETFAFDDRLSDIRRTQMSTYLADRLEQDLSSSFYLSQFAGTHRGAHGISQDHATLSNALSGQGTVCRKYVQFHTGSAQEETPIQYETAAAAFAKSTLDSGAYYKTPSSQALSLRAWVRAERLDDTNHSGSHVALVSKASSPYGNKLDHIKGYALKFGTFLNGLDTGDNAPKFILSLRNANKWQDGTTDDGCTDTVVTNTDGSTPASITTPVIDTWYNIRLDVIPFGLSYDQIKAYASLDGSTWYQLGSTVTLNRDSVKYRQWADDTNLKTDWERPQGVHNGYYVAMSSSNGKTLYTSYYLDNFQIMTDAVTS